MCAYVDPIAAGETVPDEPLFLDAELFVSVPLEATYATAWQSFPAEWRGVPEAPAGAGCARGSPLDNQDNERNITSVARTAGRWRLYRPHFVARARNRDGSEGGTEARPASASKTLEIQGRGPDPLGPARRACSAAPARAGCPRSHPALAVKSPAAARR